MLGLLLGEQRFVGRHPAIALTLAALLALALGAWLTLRYGAVSVRTTAFHGLYVADPLALLLKLGGLLFTAVSLLYSRPYLERRGMRGGEYYVLALTSQGNVATTTMRAFTRDQFKKIVGTLP